MDIKEESKKTADVIYYLNISIYGFVDVILYMSRGIQV